ncbi:hypothetical protein PAPYR_8676 [Paratrimastix pyriformis]|uniref:Uncharacterized protein n=1 Tax=Paratrimastix pyriformis TaxID=342808 RepID=A0ABQ8UEP6_9EUKA|nr:hypothetical protein PAPYR_8676 [Paratrimastix pyriformis]
MEQLFELEKFSITYILRVVFTEMPLQLILAATQKDSGCRWERRLTPSTLPPRLPFHDSPPPCQTRCQDCDLSIQGWSLSASERPLHDTLSSCPLSRARARYPVALFAQPTTEPAHPVPAEGRSPLGSAAISGGLAQPQPPQAPKPQPTSAANPAALTGGAMGPPPPEGALAEEVARLIQELAHYKRKNRALQADLDHLQRDYEALQAEDIGGEGSHGKGSRGREAELERQLAESKARQRRQEERFQAEYDLMVKREERLKADLMAAREELRLSHERSVSAPALRTSPRPNPHPTIFPRWRKDVSAIPNFQLPDAVPEALSQRTTVFSPIEAPQPSLLSRRPALPAAYPQHRLFPALPGLFTSLPHRLLHAQLDLVSLGSRATGRVAAAAAVGGRASSPCGHRVSPAVSRSPFALAAPRFGDICTAPCGGSEAQPYTTGVPVGTVGRRAGIRRAEAESCPHPSPEWPAHLQRGRNLAESEKIPSYASCKQAAFAGTPGEPGIAPCHDESIAPCHESIAPAKRTGGDQSSVPFEEPPPAAPRSKASAPPPPQRSKNATSRKRHPDSAEPDIDLSAPGAFADISAVKARLEQLGELLQQSSSKGGFR